MIIAPLVLAAVLPATASPVPRLQYLVGAWTCTYVAGATRFPYDATYAYDRDGHTLRETTSWAGGGGDEQLLGWDAKRGWTAVVFEDNGAPTIMRASGSDPGRIAYRSGYPDTSIAETFAHISATEYTIHATVRMSGKTVTSVDTCLRPR